MAKVVGMLNVSHIPAIGGAIANKKHSEPYWKPFFDAFEPVHAWLDEVKPTTAVIFYNDHGLNFFLDKMPTFAIGAAPKYTSEDEGWGIPVFSEYQGHEELSWRLIDALHEKEFDMVVCQEMVVDHAVTIPIELFWPNRQSPVKIVPVNINTVLFPAPEPARCEKLGLTIGESIENWDSDERVLIIGTGGLSHQLEGLRAGFMNKKFDHDCMDNLINNNKWFRQYTSKEIVGLAGTQGLEIINWVAARGACPEHMEEKYRFYHIPISNTAAAIQILEPSK